MAPSNDTITVESLPELLRDDNKVKLAGIDVDGMLRGKLVSKSKFLSVAKSGFGFCSVIFGWDMHDMTYIKELKISNADNGYHDLIAVPDLSSFRRIPWENNVPFFLVSFHDPDTQEPICACPRGLLKTALEKLQAKGYGAMAGGETAEISRECPFPQRMELTARFSLPAEYEFYQFKAPARSAESTSSTAGYLQENPPQALPSLTEGMFGYSLTRTVHNNDYFYDIFETCSKFKCDIEGWHTESGPGVFEAALEFGEIQQMADRASLFK